VSATMEERLVKQLKEAHAIEEQAKKLLEKGSKLAGDAETGAIYRAHLMQTEEHERYLAERLEARGERASRGRDAAMKAGALAIGAALQAAPDTPARLATAAYAFEHLEIATYRMLRTLAERAGDRETTAVAERILEQEEAAAQLVAGTFDRALEHTVGAEPVSPLPGVTPIGTLPSERTPEDVGDPGPQGAKGNPEELAT
jgi:ferritin-like metal-binding protein YciE